MIIPNYVTQKVVDENGILTPEWQIIFDTLFSQMQIYLSNEGVVIPPLTTANIAALDQSRDFTIIGDSDTNTLKVKLAGVFKTFTTS